MTDEEHYEKTVPVGGSDDDPFDVYLPVTTAMDGGGATHVVHMRGNEAGFLEVLSGFVQTGSDLSEPLRTPADHDVEQIRIALDGLGPAQIESIEQL